MRGPEGARERETLSKKERAALESLREPLSLMLETLGPEELERGTVAGIVGVDASGRLPTLLLAEVAARIQQRHGFRKPEVRFIAGHPTNLMETIREMRLPKDGTILLVDDTYARGNTLDPIEAELRALGYKVRIAAFYDSERRLLLRHPDAFYGIQDDGSDVHKHYALSGVRRMHHKPHATVLRSLPGISGPRLRKKVAAARQTLHAMAADIVAQYEAEK